MSERLACENGDANTDTSPAAKAGELLGNLLADSSHASWAPMLEPYGPLEGWPQARLRTTRRSILVAVGQLWRKLQEPMLRYPWTLAGLQGASEAERARLAEEFWNAPPCVLDGFSGKLRSLLPSAQGVLAEDIGELLQAVFGRVVPTSTYVERIFARLSRWCERPGRKPQLSTLAAKHAVHVFRNLTEQWRAEEVSKGNLVKSRSNRERPSWAHGPRKGRALNGMHIFAQEHRPRPLDGIATQWRRLPREDQEHYARLARARNVQAKALRGAQHAVQEATQGSVGGFWGMSAGAGFPMSRELVGQELSRMRALGEEFKRATEALQPENPDGFYGAPPLVWPLWAPCRQGACPHALAPSKQQYCNAMLALLREVILARGPPPTIASQEPLVLEFQSARCQAFCRVVVAYSTRKKPVEAACVRLKCVEGAVLPQGVVLRLVCEADDRGRVAMLSEVGLCVELATLATDWALATLRLAEVEQLRYFDVAEACAVDMVGVRRKLEEDKEVKDALAALKRMLHQEEDVSGGRGRGAGGRKGSGRGRGHGRGKGRGRRGGRDERSEPGGSSQSGAGSSAESEAETAGPPPRPPAEFAAARRSRMRRGQVWGTAPGFQLAPVHRGGSAAPVAWEAICGLHVEACCPALQCKKAVSCTSLSEAECQLRLKRWLVAGLDSHDWPPARRQAHLSMGGPQLSQFSEGLSLAELDAAVSHLE